MSSSSVPNVFTRGDKVNVQKAYSDAFGEGVPDETVISDPLGVITGEEGYDLRPQIQENIKPQYEVIDDLMTDGASFRDAMAHLGTVQKGLNTTDYQLPVYPLENLTTLTRRNTPFWDMIPKVSSRTKTVTQDSVTDLAQPSIGGERSVPADANDTITPQQLSMTYYRVHGSVSGPMQLASQPLRNAQAVEQRNKSDAMAHFSANLSLNGSPTSGTTDGSINDERGYKGARTVAVDNSSTASPVNGDNTTITVNDVRQNTRRAVENGGSLPSIAHFTDLKTITDLKNAIDSTEQVKIRNGPDGEISVGARSVMVDGTPVMHSDFMPNQDYNSTSNPTGRELLTVDMRFHSVHDLASLTMEPLAKTQDADEFFMKRYSVYMVDAGASDYMSLIQGLA